MNREELIKILKENLSLDIISKYGYTGFDGSNAMYTSYNVIQLAFDGEVISEIALDN